MEFATGFLELESREDVPIFKTRRSEIHLLASSQTSGVIAEESNGITAVSSKGEPSEGEGSLALFERLLLPHLNAAYNLARWITGNDHDAEDVVQEAYLRALKSFNGFRGGDGRAWLLTIVRNTCYSLLQRNRSTGFVEVFDEKIHSAECKATNPEGLVLQNLDSQLLKQVLEELPLEFREVLIMREVEELPYKEISVVAGIPIGTVMSRLARARTLLNKRARKSLLSRATR